MYAERHQNSPWRCLFFFVLSSIASSRIISMQIEMKYKTSNHIGRSNYRFTGKNISSSPTVVIAVMNLPSQYATLIDRSTNVAGILPPNFIDEFLTVQIFDMFSVRITRPFEWYANYSFGFISKIPETALCQHSPNVVARWRSVRLDRRISELVR